MTPERLQELKDFYGKYGKCDAKECLEEIERLNSENTRMRQALQQITDWNDFDGAGEYMRARAARALTESKTR